jgi:hypothetical protein
LMLKFSTL